MTVYAVNTATETVHVTRDVARGVFLLCNAGMMIGTQVGAKTFWHGTWERAKVSSEVTCSKCIKILEKK